MGLLAVLEKEGYVHDTASGGFIAPSGQGFIDTSGNRDSTARRAAKTCSIPRIVCDERIARRAAERGAELLEQHEVESASLDKEKGLWTVICSDGQTVQGRMLVIADGSNSQLAQTLGLFKSKPTGFCTRQYWRSHKVKADGVMYFPMYMLPGYFALFKHYNGDVYFGSYMLPGGAITERDLIAVHNHALKNDPFIRAALGEEAEPCEGPKVGPIRIQLERSYADHFLIVGDAAGHVDPMTGEGIHTAMQAGKLAATTLTEMFQAGNFTASAGEVYEARVMEEFGFDFRYSHWGTWLIYHCPILLDAMAGVAQRKGKDFMVDFGEIMTGVKPKVNFLQPRLAIPLVLELTWQIIKRIFRLQRASYAEVPFVPRRKND
eukprot:TRINITY_DN524_c0_g2_i4.p1 TRINITY_DN524_c0_g2~~TRINITY_DN524_c0_g2_i4.p1  ORF type:complete len:377 (-),score=49.41 TRINITY_DN524_c0_g2_i4:20-1150(-)